MNDKRAEQEEAKTPIPSTREYLSADERRAHRNHGERVVAGQRLMQSASDIFLGWTRGANGRDYYFRQLRDAKISAVIEDWDVTMLREYGKLCAWALARAHARSGDPAQIAGYMGSNSTFDDAVCEFAVEYADQNLCDYRAFVRAVREGRVPVASEELRPKPGWRR